jgi:Cft2 family RNA processing exonuclease
MSFLFPAETVQDIVMRRGRCLIPTFALGRAQELLLILDEYWTAHPELHQIPVYYASALAKKCMAVYQTYTNMMNTRVKRQIASGNNPFVFKHISNLKGRDAFDDSGPCVMMASPGMLQVSSGRPRMIAHDRLTSYVVIRAVSPASCLSRGWRILETGSLSQATS